MCRALITGARRGTPSSIFVNSVRACAVALHSNGGHVWFVIVFFCAVFLSLRPQYPSTDPATPVSKVLAASPDTYERGCVCVAGFHVCFSAWMSVFTVVSHQAHQSLDRINNSCHNTVIHFQKPLVTLCWGIWACVCWAEAVCLCDRSKFVLIWASLAVSVCLMLFLLWVWEISGSNFKCSLLEPDDEIMTHS